MTLDHAEVVGAYITLPPGVGARLVIYVNVYNPNSYDVAIRAFRGQVVLGSAYSIPINYKADGEGVWLGSDKTTKVGLPVDVPVQTALALLSDPRLAVTIPYHFSGRADVTGTRTFELERDDYAVEGDGVITREQMQVGIHLGG